MPIRCATRPDCRASKAVGADARPAPRWAGEGWAVDDLADIKYYVERAKAAKRFRRT